VAHREHSYQVLAVEPLHRNMVAVSIVLGGFVLSIAGALAFRIAWLAWPSLILGILLFGVERMLAMRVRAFPFAITARQDSR
jgi:hypothetical protein